MSYNVNINNILKLWNIQEINVANYIKMCYNATCKNSLLCLYIV